MITPTEIRQKARRQYWAFVRSILSDEPFFPLDIPFRKAKGSDNYLDLKDWVEALYKGSREEKGYGYTLHLEKRTMQRYGEQSLPAQITFDDEANYLRFIGKKGEVATLREMTAFTEEQIPVLSPWLIENPKQFVKHLAVWPDLLQVCTYFLNHPRPDCYIRELPIEVHTKFVEEHQGILRQLLDTLLPSTAIRPAEKLFERRFYLHYIEPEVRLRVLDQAIQKRYNWPVSDFSTPVSECTQLPLTGQQVVITENKITFLTLPPMPNTLAIFGGGFKVEILKDVSWLATCHILYWGDIDAHGFQILSQLRGYFPQTRSFLMDQQTFETFADYVVSGKPSDVTHLAHLTSIEHTLFDLVRNNNLRLEQERISHKYVSAQFTSDWNW